MTETSFFDPRDKLHFSFRATPFRKFIVFILGNLFKLIMDLKVQGAENLPTDGAVVLAANHVTNFDVIPMQLSIPRPIFFMGKSGLFKIPIFEAALRDLGAFPVYRGEKDEWALRHAARVLENGQVLGMFPEGTRSKGRGLSVAKTGSARLALDANCPIIPMAVIGTDSFLNASRAAQLSPSNSCRLFCPNPVKPRSPSWTASCSPSPKNSPQICAESMPKCRRALDSGYNLENS